MTRSRRSTSSNPSRPRAGKTTTTRIATRTASLSWETAMSRRPPRGMSSALARIFAARIMNGMSTKRLYTLAGGELVALPSVGWVEHAWQTRLADSGSYLWRYILRLLVLCCAIFVPAMLVLFDHNCFQINDKFHQLDCCSEARMASPLTHHSAQFRTASLSGFASAGNYFLGPFGMHVCRGWSLSWLTLKSHRLSNGSDTPLTANQRAVFSSKDALQLDSASSSFRSNMSRSIQIHGEESHENA